MCVTPEYDQQHFLLQNIGSQEFGQGKRNKKNISQEVDQQISMVKDVNNILRKQGNFY